ncbi:MULTISPECIES: putative colanic acid biosynthesis acetyltransferase [Bacteroides]|jgi:putative colanic acid biosynthesis acetyltransferase WcaF|nr:MULTISPECIES: putative colanic acid biosynthesis acetyltransferase [Bacteroides]
MLKENIDYMHFVSPYTTTNRIKRMLWEVCWTLLARPFPKSTLMPWKRFLLRMFGAKIASTVNVYASAKIFMPWNLEMKDYACIASGVDCYNAAPITIGVNATVSQRAYLCTASHNISSSRHEQIEKPIIIEDRVWVAAEAFIAPGIIIGEGAVVGARAAVFKDVEPWMVVGGNPAMYIKTRKIADNT